MSASLEGQRHCPGPPNQSDHCPLSLRSGGQASEHRSPRGPSGRTGNSAAVSGYASPKSGEAGPSPRGGARPREPDDRPGVCPSAPSTLLRMTLRGWASAHGRPRGCLICLPPFPPWRKTPGRHRRQAGIPPAPRAWPASLPPIALDIAPPPSLPRSERPFRQPPSLSPPSQPVPPAVTSPPLRSRRLCQG